MVQRLAGMRDSQTDSVHTQIPQIEGRAHEMTSKKDLIGNMIFAASHHTTTCNHASMLAGCDQGESEDQCKLLASRLRAAPQGRTRGCPVP